MNELQLDYDSPWKEAIEQYFEPFLAFFFPAAHAVIDWTRPPESLDKELQQIVREAEVGRRLADKLFKVWRLGGEDAWVSVYLRRVKLNRSFDPKLVRQQHRHKHTV
ncbi:hypothetical protein NDI39_23120 [Microcoleus sp. ZQ-A2]|nr:hypothetical protein [Microcoleus sp. FACHB-1]